MRNNFTADWAFGIKGAIENTVRSDFPQDLRSWPLLSAFNFEAYSLPENYVVIILKDKLSGIPAGPGVCSGFPHTGYPGLPPKISDLELWQFYFREKFSLRPEDAAVLFPAHDSGINDASKDFDLFSTEEQLFWHRQIAYVVAQYKVHLQAMTKHTPDQPTSITYNVTGTGARVNVNSADSSTNIVSTTDLEVFTQLHKAVRDIQDSQDRDVLENLVTEMEEAHGTERFLQKYQAFMASAANHMTVLGPLLPALSGFLS